VKLDFDHRFHFHWLPLNLIRLIFPLLDSIHGSLSQYWIALLWHQVDDLATDIDCGKQQNVPSMSLSLASFG
jgi:hypothetical protein